MRLLYGAEALLLRCLALLLEGGTFAVYASTLPVFWPGRQRDFRSVRRSRWSVCGCDQERVLGLADELYCAAPDLAAFAAHAALVPP